MHEPYIPWNTHGLIANQNCQQVRQFLSPMIASLRYSYMNPPTTVVRPHSQQVMLLHSV